MDDFKAVFAGFAGAEVRIRVNIGRRLRLRVGISCLSHDM